LNDRQPGAFQGEAAMATMYELIDVSTGNLVAVFETEEEVLASVRHTLARHGRVAATTLVLGTVDEAGDGEQIAAGDTLVARATEQVARR
jgi:hypothetical protein